MRIHHLLLGIILLTGWTNHLRAQGDAWVPKIRSSNSTIEKGDSVEISWEVKKALSIRLDGIADDLPLSGSIWLKPDTTTFYKFVFTGRRNKEIVRRRKINVVLPEAQRLTHPDNVTDEEEFHLFWLTDHAQYAMIKGIGDSLSPSGNMKIKLDTSKVFTLIAVGKYHTDTLTDSIHVKNIEDFGLTKKLVYRGDTVKLYWKYQRIGFHVSTHRIGRTQSAI